jgi:hypothetical protein
MGRALMMTGGALFARWFLEGSYLDLRAFEYHEDEVSSGHSW